MGFTSDNQLDDKRLLARVDDALAACCDRYTARFIGFLDERQARVVGDCLSAHARGISWRLYGGHEQAGRVMLGVFSDAYPDTDETFPIVPLAFDYRYGEMLTHRDVLGALLGCGIVREKVGDILCDSDKAIVFLHEDLVAFVAQEVTKIGRVGVRAHFPYSGELPTMYHFVPITGTVASARLDAVLKVLLGISREESAARVRNALVSIDHQPALSVSTPVHEGAVISVRQSGRFIVDEVSQMTKKGRLVLKARKYV